ncbi:hypothetical protein V6N11_081053 [Hibiscus sabdariffa]|uniref:Cytochrome b5 heme-binding domain-containing protein n=1 Tax=Hibiscus sabdariffa TaxID=183260 RepID=A0ABR2QJ89_9ROSI
MEIDVIVLILAVLFGAFVLISDMVYDVTLYVEEHPGGDAILAHAGDDSIEGFFKPQHATRVFDMIDDFYIGDL